MIDAHDLEIVKAHALDLLNLEVNVYDLADLKK